MENMTYFIIMKFRFTCGEEILLQTVEILKYVGNDFR